MLIVFLFHSTFSSRLSRHLPNCFIYSLWIGLTAPESEESDQQHCSQTGKSSWGLETQNPKVTKWGEESKLSSSLGLAVPWRRLWSHERTHGGTTTTMLGLLLRILQRDFGTVCPPVDILIFFSEHSILRKREEGGDLASPLRWPNLSSKRPKWMENCGLLQPMPGIDLKEPRNRSPGLLSAHRRCLRVEELEAQPFSPPHTWAQRSSRRIPGLSPWNVWINHKIKVRDKFLKQSFVLLQQNSQG